MCQGGKLSEEHKDYYSQVTLAKVATSQSVTRRDESSQKK
jgi:hypothetical protein